MARSDPQINLRIPAELKERLEQAGSASGRSTNAEIVHRLEISFRIGETKGAVEDALAQTKDNLARIDTKMAELLALNSSFDKLLAQASELTRKPKKK